MYYKYSSYLFVMKIVINTLFIQLQMILNFIGKFYFMLISETKITNELKNIAEKIQSIYAYTLHEVMFFKY